MIVPAAWDVTLHLSIGLMEIGSVAATTVLLVGRIHVDLLRVCTATCPGC